MNIYSNESKSILVENGLKLVHEFCILNNIKNPIIKITTIKSMRACGTYNGKLIKVDLSKCAKPSQLYSYPNLHSNRTPQGVITHEFGHYLADVLGISGRTLLKYRKEINEKPISSYAPNSSEWFAEIIKLYLTNPDLLKLGRPKTYNWLYEDLKLKPINRGSYLEVLKEFDNNISERLINKAKKFANIKVVEDKDLINWHVAFILTNNNVSNMTIKAKSKEEVEQIVKSEVGDYLFRITGIKTQEEVDQFNKFMKQRNSRRF